MNDQEKKSLIEETHYMAELEAKYEQAGDSFDRKLVLRKYYSDALTEIMAMAQESLSVWVDIYPFDWKFNKNERSLWSSIRHRPMVMYPEFPVLNRFVDFGNPYLKIALEADSRKFHDHETDLKRDKELYQLGWKVFRVSYQENFTDYFEMSEISSMGADGYVGDALDALENWMLHTSDGVVDAISFFYFMTDEQRAKRVKNFPEYFQFAEETLKNHRLIDFELPEIC